MDVAHLRPAIEASLRAFWDARSIGVDATSQSIDDFIDPIDSLTAVDALIDIERIVGMEIPEARVIRRGGYDSRGQFVKHLTDRVVKYVERQGK